MIIESHAACHDRSSFDSKEWWGPERRWRYWRHEQQLDSNMTSLKTHQRNKTNKWGLRIVWNLLNGSVAAQAWLPEFIFSMVLRHKCSASESTELKEIIKKKKEDAPDSRCAKLTQMHLISYKPKINKHTQRKNIKCGLEKLEQFSHQNLLNVETRSVNLKRKVTF